MLRLLYIHGPCVPSIYSTAENVGSQFFSKAIGVAPVRKLSEISSQLSFMFKTAKIGEQQGTENYEKERVCYSHV